MLVYILNSCSGGRFVLMMFIIQTLRRFFAENIEKSMTHMSADDMLDNVLDGTFFSTSDSTKHLRELCPGGFERKVTAGNLHEFCEAFVKVSSHTNAVFMTNISM